jgi:hypothetical protein
MKQPLNFSLIAALAIPVVTIIAVLLAIYIPSRNINPHYNFIYVVNAPYQAAYYYAVQDGKLTKQNVPAPDTTYPTPAKPGTAIAEPALYLHDIASNSSRRITFEEAQKLTLSDRKQSPDGYTIEAASGGGMFPFFYEGSTYGERFITNRFGSKKLQVEGDYNFQFIAWIIP